MTISLRPSQALSLWRDAALSEVKGGHHDLSLRQMSILLTVYLDAPPHTVRGLASRLGVTKPVVTRALDTMGQMKLLTRRRDPRDRRNVIIGRTLEGALYLERFADSVIGHARDLPR
ncbi:MAG: MarR family winged helix-turn-helix transcriptional regulator [Pseudomonadota bacterium]